MLSTILLIVLVLLLVGGGTSVASQQKLGLLSQRRCRFVGDHLTRAASCRKTLAHRSINGGGRSREILAGAQYLFMEIGAD